jgi:acetyl esterase
MHDVMTTGIFVFAEDAPVVARVEDYPVPVEGGEITMRVYTPAGPGPFPAHLYIHGGGFWLGTLDMSDVTCRELCAGAQCVVASVDYRLAPEHKFPTAPNDCFAALQWLIVNETELGIDTTRVSVGGASAGGNLAAVVALMARDRGGPPLVFQHLEIPATDLTMSSPSITENAEGYLLTKAGIEMCTAFYLDEPADAKHPFASPLLAHDLSGLPPALVVTCEFDPLRDEGEAYAARLRAAGVPTELIRMDGHIHGSTSFTKLMPSAREYRDQVIEALRGAYD